MKNQGKCGTDWAFAAVGVMEAANFRKSGKLVALSEQQIADCTGKYAGGYIKRHLDKKPCKGGWYYWAFNYVKRNGGIDSAAAYPYKARPQTRKCRYYI